MEFLPLLFYFIIIIPSAILHEYAHAAVADALGDKTARYAGRLTLDPRAHIDPMGTLVLPVVLFLSTLAFGSPFLFAYAKPVPFNSYNLKDQRWGPVLVALAGPAANLLLGLAFGLAFQALAGAPISIFLYVIVYANVLLAIFNLVPIPPLDGSKVLLAALPDSQWRIKQFLVQYQFPILLFFILFGFELIFPVIGVFVGLFTGGVSLF